MKAIMSVLPTFEHIQDLFVPVEERAHLQKNLGLTTDIMKSYLSADYVKSQEAFSVFKTDSVSGDSHLAIARPSPWLSGHLKRSVFQLRHLLGQKEDLKINCLIELTNKLQQNDPKTLVILRFPSSFITLNHQLNLKGFMQVGVELTGVIKIDRALDESDRSILGQLEEAQIVFRHLTEADLSQAQSITEKSHTHHHFAYDPYLLKQNTIDLFRDQVSRLFFRPRSYLIGAFKEEHLIGFIVVNKVDSFLEHKGPLLGNLDFICVDPSSSQKGIGHALNLVGLEALLKMGIKRATVRTMVNNFPAQAILSRVGWRAMLAEAVFHSIP